MKLTIGVKIPCSSTVTASAVVRMSTCCSRATSACDGLLFCIPCCVIAAGDTDRDCMHCALALATISKPLFHKSGNLANCVDCGSHSHTAARLSTIVPSRGWGFWSVITTGMIEESVMADADSASALAKYWRYSQG